MTKDTEMQRLVVNTLFQEVTESSQPKGWIQGNTKNWTRIGNHDQLSVR